MIYGGGNTDCADFYTEYSDIQNNKRNTYRRKVKEEKQAASQLEGDQTAAEGELSEVTNGAVNGHVDVDDEDRPVKKFKGEDGSAMALDADDLEDEDMEDDHDDAGDEDDPADGEEEDGVDDEPEDEEDEEEEPSGHVELIDDDEVAVGGMRDEALDDPGSESD